MLDPLYAFEISLHRGIDAIDRPRSGPPYRDRWGSWPTLVLPPEHLAMPMAVGFDAALESLGQIDRLFVEADGSFVWTASAAGIRWQLDGNLFERLGRVLWIDVKGRCPASAFDLLLGGVGWPDEPVVVQLVRSGVFLDEETFRLHAIRRGDASTAGG